MNAIYSTDYPAAGTYWLAATREVPGEGWVDLATLGEGEFSACVDAETRTEAIEALASYAAANDLRGVVHLAIGDDASALIGTVDADGSWRLA